MVELYITGGRTSGFFSGFICPDLTDGVGALLVTAARALSEDRLVWQGVQE